MKKVKLTKKQKKILQTTAVIAGGIACAVATVEIVSRSSVGWEIKNELILRLLRSLDGKNGVDYLVYTFTSNRVCTNRELIAKAHDAACELYRSIVMGKVTV